jgi:hypothetical protein
MDKGAQAQTSIVGGERCVFNSAMIKLANWYSATPVVASGHKRVFELSRKRAADHIVNNKAMRMMMVLATLDSSASSKSSKQSK